MRRRWWNVAIALIVLGSLACLAMLVGLFVLPRESTLGELSRNFAVDVRNQFVNASWREPNVAWATASPEDVGLDSAELIQLTDRLAARETSALLLVKNGSIVAEWYRSGRGPNSPFSAASLAKGLVGGPVVALALDATALELDTPAASYIDAWKGDPIRARISILDLATHTAGLEDVYFGGEIEADSGWQGEYYRNPAQRFAMAISVAPIQFEPGTQYRYSGVGYHALSYAIGRALQAAGLPDVRSLLRDRVMEPMGVPDSDWSMSYGEAYAVDGTHLYAIGSGATFSARAAARVGQLILNRGRWGERQLLSSDAVRLMTADHRVPPPDRSSGEPVPAATVGWWLNSDRIWPSVPSDALISVGANHQIVLVVPSLDLVAVRFGSSLGETHWGDGFWAELHEHFLEPLMSAIDDT